MTKEQVNEKINSLEKDLIELKKIINEPEKAVGRFRAKKGGLYWCIPSNGLAVNATDFNDDCDNYRYSTGNYFETEAETIEYRDKLLFNQLVYDEIAILNDGWAAGFALPQTGEQLIAKFGAEKLIKWFI